MARVVIVIEDHPDGTVKFTSSPSFEQMAKAIQSGEKTPASHAYALKAANAIWRASKEKLSRIVTEIPRVWRS